LSAPFLVLWYQRTVRLEPRADSGEKAARPHAAEQPLADKIS